MTQNEQAIGPAALGVLEIARGVLSELDLDVVLQRVVESAREVSGARYAALGVLNPSRTELERFITIGVDEEVRHRIGALPRGKGVLGELIANPRTLRLADVSAHPRSYGFPAEHPPMTTFLGVPLIVGGQPFGNLYLADKAGGEEFTDQDEDTLQLLAEFAGVAIDHARRYSGLEAQHAELRRTVDALDATLQIARALGGETELEPILTLVAKRGRALVSARALVIEHEQDGEMTIAACAGDLPAGLLGQRVDSQDSLAGAASRTLRTLRLEDGANRARFERHGLGRLGVRAEGGLVVPLVFRGRGHGVLIAVDRLVAGPTFSGDDQRLLEAFAASAATAVATAEMVQSERRRQRLVAAEQERARWARELHDETLQGLAALRLGLAAQLNRAEPGPMTDAVAEAVTQLQHEIAALRSLIADLRPASLDDLGVEAAIATLAERARERGLEVELEVDLASEQGGETGRYIEELETAIYRIVQEALTNAAKHGAARRAYVEVVDERDSVRVVVRDDGCGFDTTSRSAGFGLVGMHERAELLGGTLTVESAKGKGTSVCCELPVDGRRSTRVA
jgi:signal transduction histidine kinase